MTESTGNISEQVLIALRQIMRAVDLHSRQLQKRHGLTTPQALILHEVARDDGITAQEICRRVHLSRATVADILLRLEKKSLITRTRSTRDRRQVNITATPSAINLLGDALPLLHESFIRQFNELRNWEQTQILYAFQRTADMMNAEHLDASPLLTAGPITSQVEIDLETTKHEMENAPQDNHLTPSATQHPVAESEE
ncbi:MAG: MarR family transcriptional regulator [Magnetococcales bacterium]|nr:MarR family transcriptional regulator [Magnetococcales bacterium]